MENNIAQLLIKIREGDNSAFEQLCQQYSALISSLSGKYSNMHLEKNLELEDLLQESKLALYNAALKYDIENNVVTFGAFAKACIRNRLVSYLRYATSKKRCKRDSGKAISVDNPQDTVIQHELENKLMLLAEKILSGYEMRIFALYAKGARAKEISARIGKSEKSVNNAIFRIRSKLKKQSNSDT